MLEFEILIRESGSVDYALASSLSDYTRSASSSIAFRKVSAYNQPLKTQFMTHLES